MSMHPQRTTSYARHRIALDATGTTLVLHATQQAASAAGSPCWVTDLEPGDHRADADATYLRDFFPVHGHHNARSARRHHRDVLEDLEAITSSPGIVEVPLPTTRRDRLEDRAIRCWRRRRPYWLAARA